MEQTSLVGKNEWMDRIRARSVTHRQTQLGWIEEESEWIPSILPFLSKESCVAIWQEKFLQVFFVVSPEFVFSLS